MDVVFGIPDAASLGKQLDDIKKFFVKLTSLFQVNARTSHIGIIRYSESADMVVKLDQIYNIKDLSSTISGLQTRGNEMNVVKALELAADNAFTIFGGVRQTAPKTFIVFVPKEIIQKVSSPSSKSVPGLLVCIRKITSFVGYKVTNAINIYHYCEPEGVPDGVRG